MKLSKEERVARRLMDKITVKGSVPTYEDLPENDGYLSVRYVVEDGLLCVLVDDTWRAFIPNPPEGLEPYEVTLPSNQRQHPQ